MSKTYIADKETLDSVKADTGAILEGLEGIGAVKSVQTGAINAYVSVTTSKTMHVGSNGTGTNVYAYYIDVTISEVDVSKTAVICSDTGGTGTAYLLDSTTLRVIVGTTSTASCPSGMTTSNYTRWQVVEFN